MDVSSKHIYLSLQQRPGKKHMYASRIIYIDSLEVIAVTGLKQTNISQQVNYG